MDIFNRVRQGLIVVLGLWLFFSGHSLFSQNAPVTWIGSSNPCSSVPLGFPVTDTNFTNITSISLRLDYNPVVMSYDTFSAVNPVLQGLLVHDVHVSDTLNKLMIVWSDVTPRTIPSGQPLVNLQFFYNGGATNLSWNNIANWGSDCEYSDAVGNPLNDLPTDSYYKNGYIQGGIIGNAGSITGNPSVCIGDADAVYQVTPVTNATAYIWTTPPGTIITAGSGTNVIHVSFPQGSVSGNCQVFCRAGNCQGLPSPFFFVEVKPQPAPPSVSLQGSCLLSDLLQGNQWYCQNGLIAGATLPSYCPSQNGDYFDVVTEDGCPSQPSNIIHFIYSGIDNKSGNSLKIWHVAGTEVICADFEIPGEGALTIAIYDNLGAFHSSQSILLPGDGHQHVEFPVGNISRGLYVLRINITTANLSREQYEKILIY